MKIAEIIYQQLGGNRFAIMTGSKNFAAGQYFLTMHLSKNHSKAKYLTIELQPNDTYTMRFMDKNTNEINVFEGVYCDQLQTIFTQVTKLYTSL